ncbi:hypothetical protein [Aeromicrobium wangtongii]|uniref:hypothetical protein n=1 Tax=Aeromicrobium wangtongii TaxID=2969247 RepID=UPI002017FFF0|nr:hypothetical protein [Aeromicrobium wangtongii]MCL3818219.1 hypothetical protein [Aeromicrobium wangtongii]
MKTFINIMLGVVVIALIAAVYLMIKTSGGDGESEAAPEPDAIVHMSTGGVVDNIERRLESRTGRDLKVRCPKKVDSAVGTRFRCSVREAGGTEKIALATVVIDGPEGKFSWTSSSDELHAPTPAPTPTA